MSEVQFELTRHEWRDGDEAWLPRIEVTIQGTPFSAVVDTGASVSVVDVSVLEFLNYTTDEIRAGPEVDLQGVGGVDRGWLLPLDLTVGEITLRDVPCVVAAGQTDLVLLGQQDALSALHFVQDGPAKLARLSD